MQLVYKEYVKGKYCTLLEPPSTLDRIIASFPALDLSVNILLQNIYVQDSVYAPRWIMCEDDVLSE